MKKLLNISEQVESLIENKNIYIVNIEEKKEIENLLQRNNYLNVISLKYLFASGQKREERRFIHEYKYKTKFKTLRKKYNELQDYENKIRNTVLAYETELKVHLDQYFKIILKTQEISFKDNLKKLYKYNYEKKQYEKLDDDDVIFKKFDEEWGRNITKFSHLGSDWDEYFYLLIKILTFGQIFNILDLAVKQEENKYRKIYELFHIYLKKKTKFKIGNKLETIKTIGILRNALCHKESLVIFLEKGYRARNQKSNKLENRKGYKRDYLKERIESIKLIDKYYREINKLKLKEINPESWIIKYEDYRLRNGSRIKFEKLKLRP